MIVGDLTGFAAVSIGWHYDVDIARDAIERAVEKAKARHGGVLLLTDMFGGTPSNLGLTFLEAGRVEVVTDVNLPMLIKLAKAAEGADLTALARDLAAHGKAAIRVASDLLRADTQKSEA